MPWKSDAQRRWGNSASGASALGRQLVDEYNAKTKGLNLPPRLKPSTHLAHRIVRRGLDTSRSPMS